jgi:hypothetical protein
MRERQPHQAKQLVASEAAGRLGRQTGEQAMQKRRELEFLLLPRLPARVRVDRERADANQARSSRFVRAGGKSGDGARQAAVGDPSGLLDVLPLLAGRIGSGDCAERGQRRIEPPPHQVQLAEENPFQLLRRSGHLPSAEAGLARCCAHEKPPCSGDVRITSLPRTLYVALGRGPSGG